MKIRRKAHEDRRSKMARIIAAASAMMVLVAACDSDAPSPSDVQTEALQARVDALQEQHPQTPGFAISIHTVNADAISASSGVANPDGAPFDADTPVRIASITKTFVAAAALRLRSRPFR